MGCRILGFLIILLLAVPAVETFTVPAEAKKLKKCRGKVPSRYHNCFGSYTWTDGAKYLGEYRNGKMHGKGTYTFKDGRKYVGRWKNDVKFGRGTFTWPDGDKYVGEWNDSIHGRGTYTFADGRKYVGDWKEGVKEGRGTFTWPDGSGSCEMRRDEFNVLLAGIDLRGARRRSWYERGSDFVSNSA